MDALVELIKGLLGKMGVEISGEKVGTVAGWVVHEARDTIKDAWDETDKASDAVATTSTETDTSAGSVVADVPDTATTPVASGPSVTAQLEELLEKSEARVKGWIEDALGKKDAADAAAPPADPQPVSSFRPGSAGNIPSV